MRNNRLSVRVNPRAWNSRISQIFTGLDELSRLGNISLLYDATLPIAQHSTMWLSVDDKLAYFDLRDGTGIFPEELGHTDFYFKRSYRADSSAKVHPYGLHYACRRPWFGSRLWWHRGLRGIRGCPTSDCFEINPADTAERAVLFLTRIWSVEQTLGSNLESLSTLNEFRIETVRRLKLHFGKRFVGGLAPTSYARQRCPDLIAPVDTSRTGYLRQLRRCLVAVTSTGLHDSIGWKLPEYFAASRCIVTEPLMNLQPEPIVEGTHFLSYRTPAECIDACERLLDDPELASTMRIANHAYYVRNVKPAAIIGNCVQLIAGVQASAKSPYQTTSQQLRPELYPATPSLRSNAICNDRLSLPEE